MPHAVEQVSRRYLWSPPAPSSAEDRRLTCHQDESRPYSNGNAPGVRLSTPENVTSGLCIVSQHSLSATR
jgi:hypothetical protein